MTGYRDTAAFRAGQARAEADRQIGVWQIEALIAGLKPADFITVIRAGHALDRLKAGAS